MIKDTGSLLAIFGIAITLSAYLSAIRLMAIQKIADVSGNDTDAKTKRWNIKKKLGLLSIADAPMVTSAFFLGIYLLWGQLFCGVPFTWLLPAGLWLFLLAGSAMVVLHAVAWVKTIAELMQGKNG